MVRFDTQSELAWTGGASDDVNNVIGGPLVCGKHLFQRTTPTQETKRPLLLCVEGSRESGHGTRVASSPAFYLGIHRLVKTFDSRNIPAFEPAKTGSKLEAPTATAG